MLANSKKSNLRKLLTKQRKRKKKEGTGDNRKALLDSLLGKDWNKTEAIMAGKVASSEARWLRTFDVAGSKGNRLFLAGSQEHPGQIHYGGEIPEGGFAVKARVQVADIEGGQSFRILFELPSKDTLGIIFQTNRCLISEWQRDKWVDIAEAKTNTKAGEPFDVAVEVDEQLTVRINDKQVVTAAVQHELLRQGIYFAVNQSLAWLENARVEPLGQAKR